MPPEEDLIMSKTLPQARLAFLLRLAAECSATPYFSLSLSMQWPTWSGLRLG